MAGDLIAADLRTINWKPSLDSRMTEEAFAGSDMFAGLCGLCNVGWGALKRWWGGELQAARADNAMPNEITPRV